MIKINPNSELGDLEVLTGQHKDRDFTGPTFLFHNKTMAVLPLSSQSTFSRGSWVGIPSSS